MERNVERKLAIEKRNNNEGKEGKKVREMRTKEESTERKP